MSINSQTPNFAMIVAAGSGSRAAQNAGEMPKQYQKFMGKALFVHSLEALAASDLIDKILVVISPEHEAFYSVAIAELPIEIAAKLLPFSCGGATRQASVCNGLKALESLSNSSSKVYIHDAARPFIANKTLKNLSQALDKKSIYGAIPTLPIVDTIKQSVNGETIDATQERANLYAAQTPQAFHFAEILRVHKLAETQNIHGTDDASLMEILGHKNSVALVEGNPYALKITHAKDWQMAEIFYKEMHPSIPDIRTAFGFDIHRFTTGTYVTLGGIEIPHSLGVDAHSDGDVVLHALTDGILGLFGGGDIGQLFPNTALEWKNADSKIFVNEALKRLENSGGTLTHIDISILSEAPKISKYREKMLENLSALTGLPLNRIGLKATTMEKLGSLGRGEGLAAQVVVNGYFTPAL